MSSTLWIVTSIVLFFMGLYLLIRISDSIWKCAGFLLVCCFAFSAIYYLGLATIAIYSCVQTCPLQGQRIYREATDAFVRGLLTVRVNYPSTRLSPVCIFLVNHLPGGRVDDCFTLPVLRLPPYHIIHRPFQGILKHVLKMSNGLEIHQNGQAYHEFERKCMETLQNGESVLIYPEGGKHSKHRATTQGLPPFGMGAFALSFQTGVPIVPILMKQHPLAFGLRVLVPGTLEYEITHPRYPHEFPSATAMKNSIYHLMQSNYLQLLS